MSDQVEPSTINVPSGSLRSNGQVSLDQRLFIPARFSNAIQGFVFNFLARVADPNIRAPTILVLAGPPGEGKSEMVTAELYRLGAIISRLSASALSGEFEGGSLDALTTEYGRLGRRQSEPTLAAIVIDDFDLSSGRIDERLSATVNSALLNSFLMNISDNPTQLSVRIPQTDGRDEVRNVSVQPVMIILTVNDASQIYRPLIRPGRSYIYQWSPNHQERLAIVRFLFSTLSDEQSRSLASSYVDQPMSFFHHSKLLAISNAIARTTRGSDLSELILSPDAIHHIPQIHHDATNSLSFNDIADACNEMSNSIDGIRSYIYDQNLDPSRRGEI